MSDAKETQLRLAQRLLAKTQNGEIGWERTSEDDVFQASFKGYAAQVGTRSAPIGGGVQRIDYIVRVLNEDGEIVDEFADTDIPRGEALETMRQLHELARRRVLGADQALDAILGQLED